MDKKNLKRIRGAQLTNDSIDNENDDDDECDCLDTEEVLLGSLYLLHKDMKDKMDSLQTLISLKRMTLATTSDTTINQHLTSEPSRKLRPRRKFNK